MNLPGVIVDLPTVTEKDKDDLLNFGLKCVFVLVGPHYVDGIGCHAIGVVSSDCRANAMGEGKEIIDFYCCGP